MKRKVLSLPVFLTVYIVLIIVCVALDQLTKVLIFDGLLSGEEGNVVELIPNFFSFKSVFNDGAIFGLFDGAGSDIVFFVITIVASPLYVYFLIRSRTRSVWGQIGFAFIVGGAWGNAIDRAFVDASGFFDGVVRDFISFSFFPPVFNVADSFLTIGVVFAVLAIVWLDPDSLVAQMKEEKAAKQGNAAKTANSEQSAISSEQSKNDAQQSVQDAVDDNQKNVNSAEKSESFQENGHIDEKNEEN